MKRLLLMIAMAMMVAPTGRAEAYSSESFETLRADGTTLAFHLAGVPPRARMPILLMLQGSGCESVLRNDRIPWMAQLLAPDHVLLTIEKYGVETGDEGANCSQAFRRGNTLQQRVLDSVQVVSALRTRSWWNGDLIVFGGSEGGAVAAMVAPLMPEIRAVIVWSSGIGLPLGEMIRQALPPQMQAEAEQVYEAARRSPTGERQWAGASYRWWADSIDLVPARTLAQARMPVLILHGTRDQSAPIASARAARDLILASGKSDFLYREYDGYDHFMTDGEGVDRRAEVIGEAAAWLRRVGRRRHGSD